jgi:hypothetical protein
MRSGDRYSDLQRVRCGAWRATKLIRADHFSLMNMHGCEKLWIDVCLWSNSRLE